MVAVKPLMRSALRQSCFWSSEAAHRLMTTGGIPTRVAVSDADLSARLPDCLMNGLHFAGATPVTPG